MHIAGDVVGCMADKCVCGGAELSCDDVVVDHRELVAVILACILCEDGRLLLKVERMVMTDRSAWRQTGLQEFWLARDAHHPIAWYQRDDEGIILIR